jgi:YVTN family beta-propeller protein
MAFVCVSCGVCCKGQVTDMTDNTRTVDNKMYVYSNYGNAFYLIDYKTFEVVREIQLNVADTITCNGMILSTIRDCLFFKAESPYPNSSFGFAIYDIVFDKLRNVFFTQFTNVEPAYFISSQNLFAPGLIYTVFRDRGTYSIDLFEQKVNDSISDEHNFDLDKRISYSPDRLWTVVHKHWAPSAFSELEFYNTSSGLHNLQFVLNQNNKDDISIYDFSFSKNNKLYISYQLSNGRSRDIESYFGSYDLTTKQLYRSSVKFPWSLSGYFLAYSANRNEVYAVGSYGQFYIIDPESYLVKDTINMLITGEQSPIVISPDGNIAFVGYPNNNSIFVIDLNSRQVIKTITVTKPYNMIIP